MNRIMTKISILFSNDCGLGQIHKLIEKKQDQIGQINSKKY